MIIIRDVFGGIIINPTVRRKSGWVFDEYYFFPCEMLHTEQEMKEKWGDLNANRH